MGVSGSALVRAHVIQYVCQPQHPGLTWRKAAERVAWRRCVLWMSETQAQGRVTMHITIEVNGGNVQAVYADDPTGVTVTIVDWDQRQVGGQSVCEMEVLPRAAMPKATARAVQAAAACGR